MVRLTVSSPLHDHLVVKVLEEPVAGHSPPLHEYVREVPSGSLELLEKFACSQSFTVSGPDMDVITGGSQQVPSQHVWSGSQHSPSQHSWSVLQQ